MRKFGPGPGKYRLPSTLGCVDHDPRKLRLPCYSIGRRFQFKKDTTGPGPANYTTERLTRFGKDHIQGYIGEKIYLKFVNQTPGPNAYKLPATSVYCKKPPSHVIGRRLASRQHSSMPAPNAYNVPTAIGSSSNVLSVPKAPAFSIRQRIEHKQKSDVPGPKYYPKDCSKCKLHTTFKSRPKNLVKSITPGPNAYDLRSFYPGKRSPAYSMRARLADFTDG